MTTIVVDQLLSRCRPLDICVCVRYIIAGGENPVLALQECPGWERRKVECDPGLAKYTCMYVCASSLGRDPLQQKHHGWKLPLHTEKSRGGQRGSVERSSNKNQEPLALVFSPPPVRNTEQLLPAFFCPQPQFFLSRQGSLTKIHWFCKYCGVAHTFLYLHRRYVLFLFSYH